MQIHNDFLFFNLSVICGRNYLHGTLKGFGFSGLLFCGAQLMATSRRLSLEISGSVWKRCLKERRLPYTDLIMGRSRSRTPPRRGLYSIISLNIWMVACGWLLLLTSQLAYINYTKNWSNYLAHQALSTIWKFLHPNVIQITVLQVEVLHYFSVNTYAF